MSSRPGVAGVSVDAAMVLACADTMSSRAHQANPVSTGEQDEVIRQLIVVGEEKGYLLREEIDTVLPPEVTASSVMDDLLGQCQDAGVDVDSEALERDRTRHSRPVEDTNELDLTPGRRDTSSDVVRLYLAEMSRVPLLTREKEVALAKQIERGHRTVMVAISHTPSLVQQIIRLADALKEDERLIRRLVTHRHGDVTSTRLKRRLRRCGGRSRRSEPPGPTPRCVTRPVSGCPPDIDTSPSRLSGRCGVRARVWPG